MLRRVINEFISIRCPLFCHPTDYYTGPVNFLKFIKPWVYKPVIPAIVKRWWRRNRWRCLSRRLARHRRASRLAGAERASVFCVFFTANFATIGAGFG